MLGNIMASVVSLRGRRANLEGKTVLITGANSGLGFALATKLARRAARIILACRDAEQGERARQALIDDSNNQNIVFEQVDLSSMKSIRGFVERIIKQEKRLDILVNNAGVFYTGEPEELTEDGLEKIFATNYFGPFLLTNLLLGLMKASAPSRIINVSDSAHQSGEIDFDNLSAQESNSQWQVYSNSKLAILLFTRELASRLEGTGVVANALHPGMVSTQLRRNYNFMWRVTVELFRHLISKDARTGAETSFYLVVIPSAGEISGKYFEECKVQEDRASPLSRDLNLAQQLWKVSEELTGLKQLHIS